MTVGRQKEPEKACTGFKRPLQMGSLPVHWGSSAHNGWSTHSHMSVWKFSKKHPGFCLELCLAGPGMRGPSPVAFLRAHGQPLKSLEELERGRWMTIVALKDLPW